MLSNLVVMNVPKILNYGSKFFNKFPQSLPVFTAVGTGKLGLLQSSLFSSFCNSNRISECSKLILASYTPLLVSSRGMKVRGHLQLRCKDCYFERKDGILYVNCSSYPRHKQRQLTKRTKYTWILTYAFMSKKRPW